MLTLTSEVPIWAHRLPAGVKLAALAVVTMILFRLSGALPVALALAALMLSNVRIPKLRFPKNKGKLVVSLVLMLVLLVLAVLRAFPQAHLLSGVGYLVIGAMIGAKSKSTN